jgi:hypothetical protein
MIQGLHIERLLVRSLEIERKEVTWETTNTSADPLDFTFQVLRSESPEGPFEAVSPIFEDRYLFVDSRIPAGDKFRQLWYRLRVTHKTSGETKETGSVTHEAEPDLVAQFIRRSEQTLFTQIVGRQCWLLKRRSFGPRCPSCWDRTTQKRTRAQCLDCFNTGFLRGYHDPVEVWVQIDPPGKSVKNNAQQIDHEVFSSARMTFYPNLNPHDVLVEAENKRWRVVTVQLSERLRAPIKQEFQLRQIQDTDIEYRLPINVQRALRDIQPSPSRMFTNPADLASAIDERVPNLFDNYPSYPVSEE